MLINTEKQKYLKKNTKKNKYYRNNTKKKGGNGIVYNYPQGSVTQTLVPGEESKKFSPRFTARNRYGENLIYKDGKFISKYSDLPKSEPNFLRSTMGEIVNIRDQTLLNLVKSNYQYFAFNFHDKNCQIIIEDIYDSLFNPDQVGGLSGICNGEFLLTENEKEKEHFYNLGRLKYHMDRQHDFKGDKQLDDEKEIFIGYEKILDHFNTNDEGKRFTNDEHGNTLKEFFNSVFRPYSSLASSEREHYYFLKTIEFLSQNCSIINSLYLAKYTSDKTIISGITDNDLIIQYSVDSNEEDDDSNEYYVSTIDNKKLEVQYTEDQVNFAYVDNSISKKILYPLCNLLQNDGEKLLITESLYEDFTSKLDNGRVNTVANFLDPVNTSRKFNVSTVIPDFTYRKDIAEDRPSSWPSKDSIESVKSRIQITQNLDDIYSFYTILILSKGFEDFFKYYGSLLKVDFKGQLNDEEKRKEILRECNNYLKTGNSDRSIFRDTNGEFFRYPIRFKRVSTNKEVVLGIELDIYNYKKGAAAQNTTLEFFVGDTTINNIQEYINTRFNLDTPPIKDISYRLWKTGRTVLDGIPKEKLYKDGISDKELMRTIILSLKAFGDSLQINYSKRLNDYMENGLILMDSVGIRSTDKNVLSEGLLLNLPVWSTNNGINSNRHWLEDKEIIDFAKEDFSNGKMKMFITNYERNNNVLYLSSLIKSINKLKYLIQTNPQPSLGGKRIQYGGNAINCNKDDYKGVPLWDGDEANQSNLKETVKILWNRGYYPGVRDGHYFTFNGKVYKLKKDTKAGYVTKPVGYCEKDVSGKEKIEGIEDEIEKIEDEIEKEEIEEITQQEFDEKLQELESSILIDGFKLDDETINKIKTVLYFILKSNNVCSEKGYSTIFEKVNLYTENSEGEKILDYKNIVRNLDIFLKDIIDVYENLFSDNINDKVTVYNDRIKEVCDTINNKILDKNIGSLSLSQQVEILNRLEGNSKYRSIPVKTDHKIINIFNILYRNQSYMNKHISQLIEDAFSAYQGICQNLYDYIIVNLIQKIREMILVQSRRDVVYCIKDKIYDIWQSPSSPENKLMEYRNLIDRCYENLEDKELELDTPEKYASKIKLDPKTELKKLSEIRQLPLGQGEEDIQVTLNRVYNALDNFQTDISQKKKSENRAPDFPINEDLNKLYKHLVDTQGNYIINIIKNVNTKFKIEGANTGKISDYNIEDYDDDYSVFMNGIQKLREKGLNIKSKCSIVENKCRNQYCNLIDNIKEFIINHKMDIFSTFKKIEQIHRSIPKIIDFSRNFKFNNIQIFTELKDFLVNNLDLLGKKGDGLFLPIDNFPKPPNGKYSLKKLKIECNPSNTKGLCGFSINKSIPGDIDKKQFCDSIEKLHKIYDFLYNEINRVEIIRLLYRKILNDVNKSITIMTPKSEIEILKEIEDQAQQKKEDIRGGPINLVDIPIAGRKKNKKSKKYVYKKLMKTRKNKTQRQNKKSKKYLHKYKKITNKK